VNLVSGGESTGDESAATGMSTMPPSIRLRQYQPYNDLWQLVLPAKGHALKMATGNGKTITALAIALPSYT